MTTTARPASHTIKVRVHGNNAGQIEHAALGKAQAYFGDRPVTIVNVTSYEIQPQHASDAERGYSYGAEAEVAAFPASSENAAP